MRFFCSPIQAKGAKEKDPRWLIEDLWADQAVGILGGEPKCCKSFLALGMAVSVASGAACLRRFPVLRTAPKLLLDLPQDRERLRETVARINPALLILDPFIRLHRSDENASKEVAPDNSTARSENRLDTILLYSYIYMQQFS